MEVTEARKAKDYWATHHNQTARLTPREEQPHRWEVAEYIDFLVKGNEYPRILEFGCSSGRNLAVLRMLLPKATLNGVDANEITIEAGRNAHDDISFVWADEDYLLWVPDKIYDVAFTVSVLDHIPNPEWRQVYNNLRRIARHVVMLEPMAMGGHGTGWVEEDFAQLGVLASPYSYSHDYLGHDPAIEVVRHLPIESALWPEFGQCYHLLHRGPEDAP